ncbi:unnamed protein product, partial [Discosporangium mesarthrocarpum]
SFPHGTFEKVNYLGYDDHVVIAPAVDFLLKENDSPSPPSGKGSGTGGSGRGGEGGGGGVGGKLLTILTVGPHHYHDVPRSFTQGQGPAGATTRLHAKYLNALHYQDLFLSRLNDALHENGLGDNTYIILVGDHGEVGRVS